MYAEESKSEIYTLRLIFLVKEKGAVIEKWLNFGCEISRKLV